MDFVQDKNCYLGVMEIIPRVAPFPWVSLLVTAWATATASDHPGNCGSELGSESQGPWPRQHPLDASLDDRQGS